MSTPLVPQTELGRRVQEQLNDSFDWDPARRVKRWAERKPRKPPIDPLPSLPQQPAPQRAGMIRRLTPTMHEQDILRRASRGFILVTQREEKTLYLYEDGSPVRNEHGALLSRHEWRRLQKFLVADTGDSLFPDGAPQRFNVRRPDGGDR